MKIIICITIFTAYLFPQDHLIDSLSSNNMGEVFTCLAQIGDFYMSEAIPVIHDNFNNYDLETQLFALIVLNQLNDSDFTHWADYFITHLPPSPLPQNSSEYRSIAFLLLFNETGQSGFEEGHGYYDTRPNADYYYIFLRALSKALNFTQYEVYAKNKLIEIMQTNSSPGSKIDAMYYLYEKYGTEVLPLIRTLFLSSADEEVRLNCVLHLVKVKDTETRDWIYQNVFNEDSSTIQFTLAKYLLDKFGEPKDLKIVSDLLSMEQSPRYINFYQFYRERFIPPQFESSLNSIEIAEKIFSHVNDLVEFEWCSFDYSARFKEIRDAVLDSNTSLAIQLLDDALYKVEVDYQDGKITLDGYKFLKYEPQYLKEKLEQ